MHKKIAPHCRKLDRHSHESSALGIRRRLCGAGVFAALLLLKLTWVIAVAQAPDPGSYSPAKYELQERRGVMVPMRDGTRLAVDIYAPKTSEKLPVILSITPYGRTELYSQARRFATRGYIFVAADSRGRYDSDGVWDPFNAKHKTDGYDLVEWSATQSWSSGRVGMWGASFLGWTQWWTASMAPPHLVTIVPVGAPPDQFQDTPYRQGVLSGGWAPDWVSVMSGRTTVKLGEGPYAG